jgi:hypothetical protein
VGDLERPELVSGPQSQRHNESVASNRDSRFVTALAYHLLLTRRLERLSEVFAEPITIHNVCQIRAVRDILYREYL